jgi:multidrug resistance protein
MGCLIDLYVPSLPIITNFFHTTHHLAQFSVAIYLLGYAVGQIVTGILADCYGRRKLILVSTGIFVLASLFAAFSQNIYQFDLCRLLQGIAASGLSLSRAITKDVFSGLELTKAINTMAISWALGPIIGPFVGSYIQHFFGWQTNFFFFAIYGIFLFIFFYLFIPETHFKLLKFDRKKISKIFILALNNKFFLCLSILVALNYSISVIFNTIGPFIIEEVLKYSVIEYGFIALVLGVGYFVGNIFNRMLIHYLPPIKVAFIGIAGGLVINIIFFGLA